VRANVIRRHLGSLALVASVATAAELAAAQDSETTTTDTGAVAVQHVHTPGRGLRDEAAMVLVGTALIGLAAAVKRAA